LNLPYFHIVFTLPAPIAAVAFQNKSAVYAILFKTVIEAEAVTRRYYRWIEMGVLDEILAALAREADLEWLMIDSTIARAHQHAAGARRQKGGRMPRALVAPAEAHRS
jgi:transposase